MAPAAKSYTYGRNWKSIKRNPIINISKIYVGRDLWWMLIQFAEIFHKHKYSNKYLFPESNEHTQVMLFFKSYRWF